MALLMGYGPCDFISEFLREPGDWLFENCENGDLSSRRHYTVRVLYRFLIDSVKFIVISFSSRVDHEA